MGTITPVKSLHEHIAYLSKISPTRPALLTCDGEGMVVEEITYEELSQKVGSASAYFQALGLKKGDRIALAFKNSAELLILSWAAWSVGIVTVPLDTKRDTAELYEYKIKLNNAKLLVVQEGILKEGEGRKIDGVETREFSGFENASNNSVVESELPAQEGLSHTALVLFTSGTTSYPKGAKLTLENLIVNAQGIREWLNITDEDRFLVNLPLHHINSTTFCLSMILAGGSVAIPPSYSNSHFWQQTARTRSTLTSIVQSIVFDQLSRIDEYAAIKDMLKLNRIQIGSAPVVAQTAQEFIKKFRIPLYQGYGQTETALRVTGVPMNLSKSLYGQLVEENSIGAPMSWAKVEITDEEGNILGENQEGELVVKGPAVMEGYLGNEPAFRNGYFLTGDIGIYRMIDGKRYFFLKGRKKEMIIKGGINISPVAVENHLKKISDDIGQVYVIGFPDERYGEEVAAVICWRKDVDEESAKRRLKFKLISGTPFLSSYETPKYMCSIDQEDLPTTSTGKVQRTVLKSKTPVEKFESVHTLLQTSSYKFSILDPQSPYFSASHALYNHCWQPLAVEIKKYKEDMNKQFILLAIDSNDKVAGQIAFIRTDLGSEELLHTAYDSLFGPNVSNPAGKAFVCVSICSSDYEPKPVLAVAQIPDNDVVRKYLAEEGDPVLKFHQKPKGGLPKGAELIDVIPNGRPEDMSSLGYNMLLKYPSLLENVGITDGAPVSNQLIEAVLLIAKDMGMKDVYAYSRPGSLASYVSSLA